MHLESFAIVKFFFKKLISLNFATILRNKILSKRFSNLIKICAQILIRGQLEQSNDQIGKVKYGENAVWEILLV